MQWPAPASLGRTWTKRGKRQLVFVFFAQWIETTALLVSEDWVALFFFFFLFFQIASAFSFPLTTFLDKQPWRVMCGKVKAMDLFLGWLLLLLQNHKSDDGGGL
jgi:hypothetical protein